MKLPELGWLQERLNLWGQEIPIEIPFFIALGLIVLFILIAIVRAKKAKNRRAVEVKVEKNQAVHKPLVVAEPTSTEPTYTSPAPGSDSKTREALETMLNESIKGLEDSVSARFNRLYSILPELSLVDSLEDFEKKGLTTLDLREKIQMLLNSAGAIETTLEPRSVGRHTKGYREALIEYIQLKVDEIDQAYMSRVFRPEHYSALGCFYYHKKAFDKAIGCFEKAIEANQYNAPAWNNKAVVLMEMDKNDEALECYSKALELSHDSPTAWFGKGLILCDNGDHEEGLKAIEKAIDLRPIWPDAWYEKGLVLSSQKRFQEALKSFAYATLMNPQDERPWQAKGITYSQLGMHEEALSAYQQVLALKPDDEEAWYGKSIALSYLGMYEEAISSFDLVLSLNRRNHKAWYGRGLAYLYLKHYDYALESFKNAIEINSSYSKAWYNKAVVHSTQEDREGALESLKMAIELDSRFKAKARGSEDFSRYQTDEAFIKLWGNDEVKTDG